MRARTFVVAVSAVSVGFLILVAPHVVGFTVMVLGAVAFYRASRRWGVRR